MSSEGEEIPAERGLKPRTLAAQRDRAEQGEHFLGRADHGIVAEFGGVTVEGQNTIFVRRARLRFGGLHCGVAGLCSGGTTRPRFDPSSLLVVARAGRRTGKGGAMAGADEPVLTIGQTQSPIARATFRQAASGTWREMRWIDRAPLPPCGRRD